MKEILIQVTQKHIDEGKSRHISACPIALALEDAGFTHVSVGPTDADLTSTDVCDLPPEVTDFIKKFDENGPKAVSPFQFTITPKKWEPSND